ncbi:MAG: BrnA antitoxin family protein [Rhodoferax sp.]|nr:BrnA antitoxin family protein [Rhodoferax sp.]
MKDPELSEFENDLLESIMQAKRGEFARVTTPAQIAARRGRPVGSVQATTKTPTTLRLNTPALNRWRASGKGWQTRAAAILEQHAPQISA